MLSNMSLWSLKENVILNQILTYQVKMKRRRNSGKFAERRKWKWEWALGQIRTKEFWKPWWLRNIKISVKNKPKIVNINRLRLSH